MLKVSPPVVAGRGEGEPGQGLPGRARPPARRSGRWRSPPRSAPRRPRAEVWPRGEGERRRVVDRGDVDGHRVGVGSRSTPPLAVPPLSRTWNVKVV